MDNVRILDSKNQKYVLVTVKNSEKNFIWGNPNVEWHKSIVKEIINEGYEILSVEGGGWMRIAKDTKVIYVCGEKF